MVCFDQPPLCAPFQEANPLFAHLLSGYRGDQERFLVISLVLWLCTVVIIGDTGSSKITGLNNKWRARIGEVGAGKLGV